MTQNLQQMKKAFLMGKQMFILEVNSWNFLSIFEAETNLFHGYKIVYFAFVIELFKCRENFFIENIEIILYAAIFS